MVRRVQDGHGSNRITNKKFQLFYDICDVTVYVDLDLTRTLFSTHPTSLSNI